MPGFLSRFFDSNQREIKKLLPLVRQINSLEEEMRDLADQDFPKKTAEFRERVAGGEDIFLILPEVFALVREASRRAIDARLYDVQLMAGIVLAKGAIAEQKTGEGKTFSAVPALYLHALTGKPVHLVTVNDYLARRDAGWMGAVFNFLGLTVSSIINEQSFLYDPLFLDKEARDYRLVHLRPISRKEAYQADIVYGINSEFGFDYLRDNMVFDSSQIVQRGHYFAIIDEVDSVLIDEARTPHIISVPDEKPSQRYYEYARIVEKLNPDVDYKVDEKMRTAHLTDHGIAKIEKMFGIKDIYERDFDTVYHLEAALKAKTLFFRDRDYVVRNNEVVLVDEFTGRLLEGRRLSEGLHQAIEAKEGLPVEQESKTLATISLQNYFRMYEKLAGMTGTAVTESEEFKKIYNLDVVVIPTNKPMIRQDLPDIVYKTARAKYAAIADEIEKAYKRGQPVLMGTTSIEKNEIISELLKRRGIPHEVLNAKNHTREALIIKDAGKKSAVTVATNMAGRGVDIILGGQPPSKFELKYQDKAGKKLFDEEMKEWERNHKEVVEAGGLFVIGTEKHESRRIDNQLRGRAGRQGDPGKSVFIISLEDDLMRVFGGDQIAGLMTRFNFPENTPLTHPLVSKVIEQAQIKVEGFNFEIRKNLLEFDDVLNKQRDIIYKLRRKIVEEKKDVIELILEKTKSAIENIVEFNLGFDGGGKEKIIEKFCEIIPFDENSQKNLLNQISMLQSKDEIIEFLSNIAVSLERKREEEAGLETARYVAKVVFLSVIDNLWMEHLTTMEDLRAGISLRGYGQRNPLIEYKNESFKIFEQMMHSIDDELLYRFFRVNFLSVVRPQERTNLVVNKPESEISKDGLSQKSSQKDKLGRNDPCWCGSGKKFKKCHWPNVS